MITNNNLKTSKVKYNYYEIKWIDLEDDKKMSTITYARNESMAKKQFFDSHEYVTYSVIAVEKVTD